MEGRNPDCSYGRRLAAEMKSDSLRAMRRSVTFDITIRLERTVGTHVLNVQPGLIDDERHRYAVLYAAGN
jgi:hypothetical protein